MRSAGRPWITSRNTHKMAECPTCGAEDYGELRYRQVWRECPDRWHIPPRPDVEITWTQTKWGPVKVEIWDVEGETLGPF